jgi:lysophospholipase L1-like esterase
VDLHGFVLSNEKPGLLYHTIGINGARYIDYRRNPSAMKGWGQLNPDLFILSLGTNEVILWEFDPNKNIRQLDSFFSLFRELYPEVPVIIELPFDHKFRRARTNARFPLLNANLVRMADKYRAAIWDGYHAGGGYGSAYYWNRAGLLTYDGIHYTREGYRVQGEMLRDAIINGYGDRFNERK